MPVLALIGAGLAWIFVALLVVAILLIVGLWRVRRAEQKAPRVSDTVLPGSLEPSRLAAADDIAKLKAALDGLDEQVADQPFDEGMQDLYQQALTEYDRARRGLPLASSAADLAAVTTSLGKAHESVAGVRAALDGKPLISPRPPCFFDPAHGPSVTSVAWGGADQRIRHLPSCQECARRVLNGGVPEIRTVPRTVLPYWRADSLGPWASGYFTSWLANPLLGEALDLLVAEPTLKDRAANVSSDPGSGDH